MVSLPNHHQPGCESLSGPRFDPFDRLRVLSESKDKLTTLSKPKRCDTLALRCQRLMTLALTPLYPDIYEPNYSDRGIDGIFNCALRSRGRILRP